MTINFNEAVFGKNDIRAIVGENGVTPELFRMVGKAFAKYISDRIPQSENDRLDVWVSVAQDARTHSPELTNALITGLTASGINVLDLGLCPTPLAYYSENAKLRDFSSDKTKAPNLVASLIVTASHNPSEYNGLKMTFKKAALTEAEIAEVRDITKKGEFIKTPRIGIHKKYNLISEYIDTIVNSFSTIGKGLKVVVDSGNATGGVVGPQLYREMGCEVIDIFTEPDGNFPNHHPNPSDEKNLIHLKQKILETGADFGIAFDGDSDRVGIVDNTGYSLPGDQLLLIYALDILNDLKTRDEKPVFISEVKCSQVLFDTINKNGGQAIMWKTGHAYIKTKMKEENAILAGEMSGHIFFRDRYYGFDDAFYAGCRFIEIMAKNRVKNPSIKASDIIANLPQAVTSREVRTPCPNEHKKEVLAELQREVEKNSDMFGSPIEKIITLDGMRIVFDGGFALIRQSNTEPTFTLRFEGKTEEECDRYKVSMLKALDEKIENAKEKSLCK